MRRAVIATFVVIALLAGLIVLGVRGYRYVYERVTPEGCTVIMDDGVAMLSPEQARNASIIVAVSAELGLSERAAVIALATAYQESGLRNLDYGDRDSLGLFQQRPSYGWGTEEQLLDPWYSSARFYEELVKFDGWATGDVNDVAQQVQRSGYPEAYRQHVDEATAVAAALRGSRPETLSCLSFADSPTADTTAFERQIEALGDDVQLVVADGEATLTSPDSATLWAAAHIVIANSYAGGVTSVVVEDREWTSDDAAWAAADQPAPHGTAVLTLG